MYVLRQHHACVQGRATPIRTLARADKTLTAAGQKRKGRQTDSYESKLHQTACVCTYVFRSNGTLSKHGVVPKQPPPTPLLGGAEATNHRDPPRTRRNTKKPPTRHAHQASPGTHIHIIITQIEQSKRVKQKHTTFTLFGTGSFPVTLNV